MQNIDSKANYYHRYPRIYRLVMLQQQQCHCVPRIVLEPVVVERDVRQEELTFRAFDCTRCGIFHLVTTDAPLDFGRRIGRCRLALQRNAIANAGLRWAGNGDVRWGDWMGERRSRDEELINV